MTEEIIVNGLNVAGCEHYSGNKIYLENKDWTCRCSSVNTKCEDNPNCYYKQLKRLEQERDELKKTCEKCKLFDIEKTNRNLLERIDKLEQENKELKEWKDKVVKLFESACRCKYLNEETDICSYTNEKCININKCAYKYQELSDNYRSALEEIRENLVKLKTNDEDDFFYEYSKIEDKINECIGE